VAGVAYSLGITRAAFTSSVRRPTRLPHFPEVEKTKHPLPQSLLRLSASEVVSTRLLVYLEALFVSALGGEEKTLLNKNFD